MRIERRTNERPFFSVCIPQHNRTSFLLETLRSLAVQTFRDFECCISDDCSNDGRQAEVQAFLDASGFSFVYEVQPNNVRYDANLRSAIALARGRYCFLLGNDDALARANSMEFLKTDMETYGPAAVVITDFEDFASAVPAKRIRRTACCGSGPGVAVAHFRNFSFVSGIVLKTEPAQALATDRWDGSEMYQTFIGSRMIAAGSPLLELETILIRKDIRIPGENVDNYAAKPRLHPCPIVERRIPLSKLGRLVVDAVEPYVRKPEGAVHSERIFLQLLLFTYPYWILEYRRIQSWRYALGICLGMRPAIILQGVNFCFIRRLRLSIVYLVATALGLIVPPQLFRLLQTRLYHVAKTAFRRSRVPRKVVPE